MSVVSPWNDLNCQSDPPMSVGGANAALVQPIGLVWSRFFGNLAVAFSEDLKELFPELVKNVLNLVGSVDLGAADPEDAVDEAGEFIGVLGVLLGVLRECVPLRIPFFVVYMKWSVCLCVCDGRQVSAATELSALGKFSSETFLLHFARCTNIKRKKREPSWPFLLARTFRSCE